MLTDYFLAEFWRITSTISDNLVYPVDFNPDVLKAFKNSLN